MICPHCKDSIELKHTRDRETRMMSNYWWCDDCKKKVSPAPEESEWAEMVASTIESMNKSMWDDMSQVLKDRAVYGQGRLHHISSPNGKSPMVYPTFKEVIIDEVVDDEI